MADLIRLVPRIPPDDRGVIPLPIRSLARPEAPCRVAPSGPENRGARAWGGHLPAELTALPLDRALRPQRHWARGAFLLAALVWICADIAAIGALIWALHWIFGG